jgi:hypothetical protein
VLALEPPHARDAQQIAAKQTSQVARWPRVDSNTPLPSTGIIFEGSSTWVERETLEQYWHARTAA